MGTSGAPFISQSTNSCVGASYSRKFGVYVGIYIDDWWKELVSSGPDFVKWLEAFGYRFKGVSSVILLL